MVRVYEASVDRNNSGVGSGIDVSTAAFGPGKLNSYVVVLDI